MELPVMIELETLLLVVCMVVDLHENYAGLAGIAPSQPANPALKWEETAQLDIGISAEMFNSRVNIDVNYYIKQTSDLLLDFQLADVNGIHQYYSKRW